MHSTIIKARKPTTDTCCGVHDCCTPHEHAVDPLLEHAITQRDASQRIGVHEHTVAHIG